MQLHCIPSGKKERGVTLLEVLVTILIVTFGLLGLAGLQARIQAAELESYQRVQAIVLLQDMVDRLNANRKQAGNYATSGAAVGTGSTLNCSSSPTNGYLKDLCDIDSALKGASETDGGSVKLGAMIGARGCFTQTTPFEYVVAVAWQGLTATATPTAATCGSGEYGTNEALRRVITARVVFACLQNDASGTNCIATAP